MIMKSLEEFRTEHNMEIREFSEFLEISPHIYNQMLKRETPMQHVAERLDVPTGAIREFFPQPSPELLTQISERIDHAELQGALVFDIERGKLTEERVALSLAATF